MTCSTHAQKLQRTPKEHRQIPRRYRMCAFYKISLHLRTHICTCGSFAGRSFLHILNIATPHVYSRLQKRFTRAYILLYTFKQLAYIHIIVTNHSCVLSHCRSGGLFNIRRWYKIDHLEIKTTNEINEVELPPKRVLQKAKRQTATCLNRFSFDEFLFTEEDCY